MARVFVAELTRTALLVYSLLLLGLQLAYTVLTVQLVGWTAVWHSTWIAIVGFLAFPLLLAAGGRVELSIRGRRRELSRVAFLSAWALAYMAARTFFRGSAAHDLDLMLDGSHGRFCGDPGYWFDGATLAKLLFCVVPALWWLTRPAASAGSAGHLRVGAARAPRCDRDQSIGSA